jgi:hypothetical protein
MKINTPLLFDEIDKIGMKVNQAIAEALQDCQNKFKKNPVPLNITVENPDDAGIIKLISIGAKEETALIEIREEDFDETAEAFHISDFSLSDRIFILHELIYLFNDVNDL